MVKSGAQGDASVLQPTIMFCVPLILDKIYKVILVQLLALLFLKPLPLLLVLLQGITEQIRKKGDTVSSVLDFLIQYKIQCSRRGEPTPIMDRLVFRR